MPVLNQADNLYLGAQADASYLAGVKVWPPPPAIRTIFTHPIASQDTGDQGYSFRSVVPITGPGGTQLRVTIQGPQSSQGTIADHMSVGISAGGTGSGNIQGPFGSTSFNELFVGGVSGFTVAPNAQVVTDWQNISGFAATDYLVFAVDCSSAAGAMNAAYSQPAGSACYYSTGLHYNAPTFPGSYLGVFCFCIIKIEVQ